MNYVNLPNINNKLPEYCNVKQATSSIDLPATLLRAGYMPNKVYGKLSQEFSCVDANTRYHAIFSNTHGNDDLYKKSHEAGFIARKNSSPLSFEDVHCNYEFVSEQFINADKQYIYFCLAIGKKANYPSYVSLSCTCPVIRKMIKSKINKIRRAVKKLNNKAEVIFNNFSDSYEGAWWKLATAYNTLSYKLTVLGKYDSVYTEDTSFSDKYVYQHQDNGKIGRFEFISEWCPIDMKFASISYFFEDKVTEKLLTSSKRFIEFNNALDEYNNTVHQFKQDKLASVLSGVNVIITDPPF